MILLLNFQAIAYALSPDEALKVWPTSMNLTDFVNNLARRVVERSINNYFTKFEDLFDDLETETEERLNGLNAKIKNLQTFCINYIDHLAVTGDFIRYISQSILTSLFLTLTLYVTHSARLNVKTLKA